MYKRTSFDFYQIVTYFLILSFCGWIFETMSIFLLQGQLTDRGLLFVGNTLATQLPFLSHLPRLADLPFVWGLPIIPIYGFGGVIIVYAFHPLRERPLLLFFVSMIAMTLFELFGSYFCQYIIHKQYWDYSNEFLNFQGRICLRSSLAWGVLSLLVSKLLSLELKEGYRRLQRLFYFRVTVVVLSVFAVFCSIIKYFV